MKFCKQYQEYMQGQKKKLPGLGIKNLKKILKKCRSDLQCHNGIDGVLGNQTCPDHCTGNLKKKKKKIFFTHFCFNFLYYSLYTWINFLGSCSFP